MPVMDGWEFRVEQRADPLLAGIPLLAMSADLSAKARAIAADGYVRKPIDFPDLLRQLHGAVGRAARAAAGRRRSDGRAGHARLRHRARDQQPAHVCHCESANAGRATPASTDKTMRELTDIVADALDGAQRIRKLVKQVQMVVARPAPANGRRSWRCARRCGRRWRSRRTRSSTARTDVRRGPGPLRARRPRTHRTTIRQPAAQRRAGDPRGARQQERDPRQRAPAAGAERGRREIADSGAGIPLEVQERIFQPFFTTKPIGQGTGLGLSVCRGIVTALGGEISFQSEPAAGTTFRVVLPTTARPA